MQDVRRRLPCETGARDNYFYCEWDSIALMPCNPNIGGSSKGHLVREIDALGGRWESILIRHLFSQKC